MGQHRRVGTPQDAACWAAASSVEKSKAGSRPDSLGKKIFNTASPQRKTPLVPGVRGVSSAQGNPSRRQISRARGVKAGMLWKTRPQSRQDCIDSVKSMGTPRKNKLAERSEMKV